MERQVFASRAQAARTVATRIAGQLRTRLEANAEAAFIVSGGSTPAGCFSHLSHKQLDWHRVTVLLSDERWVAPDHADSNERMLRETLMVSRARYVRLLPYYDSANSVFERCNAFEDAFKRMALPFCSVLLGMGADGHFAGLFPGSEGLSENLDPDSSRRCVEVTTPASPYARISLTLSALLESEEILLLIFGEEKRAVLDTALNTESDLPVAALLRQQKVPVHVFWAP